MTFSPTPTVRWERIGGPLASKVEHASFGQELVIKDAQYDDAGTYRCLANNTKSGTPVSKTFELKVNCKCIKDKTFYDVVDKDIQWCNSGL